MGLISVSACLSPTSFFILPHCHISTFFYFTCRNHISLKFHQSKKQILHKIFSSFLHLLLGCYGTFYCSFLKIVCFIYLASNYPNQSFLRLRTSGFSQMLLLSTWAIFENSFKNADWKNRNRTEKCKLRGQGTEPEQQGRIGTGKLELFSFVSVVRLDLCCEAGPLV